MVVIQNIKIVLMLYTVYDTKFQVTQLQHHSFNFALPKVIQEVWEGLEKVSVCYKTRSILKLVLCQRWHQRCQKLV